MNDSEKIRILLAKAGLDGHDRGVKVIAAAFRDAGFEVIYTGLRQTPGMIVEAALQEDVDAVGVSILSGAHMTLFPAIQKLMQEKNCSDMILFGGGIMDDEDIKNLEHQGIDKLFGPGTSTQDIIKYIKGAVAEKRKKEKIV
jgi:methylmalonyl-CoA mutase C-terminal domain/subunit